MPCDIEINMNIPEIKFFSSKVMDIITTVSLIASHKHHELLGEWALSFRKKYLSEYEHILDKISCLQLEGMEVMEFVLLWKCFDDVTDFINRMFEIDEDEFLYIFFGESVSIENIKTTRCNKDNFDILNEENNWLITPENEEVIKYMFYEFHDFRSQLMSLLKSIDNEMFEEKRKSIFELYEDVIQLTRENAKDKKPLHLAQEIMGKKFRRVSEYKTFYYIPSYFISPHKIRVFNNEEVMIVFDTERDNTYTKKVGDEVSKALKVISDRTRLDILRQLMLAPNYGKVLAGRLDLTTATISHHLEQLKNINLIKEEKIKNIKYFSANTEEVEKLLKNLNGYLYGIRKK